MTEDTIFDLLEADDVLPGAHNGTALVHNPFVWELDEEDTIE